MEGLGHFKWPNSTKDQEGSHMKMLNIFNLSANRHGPCLHGAFELVAHTQNNQIITQKYMNLAIGEVSMGGDKAYREQGS